MEPETETNEARGSVSLDNLQDGTYWLADGILRRSGATKGYWVASHRGTDALLDRELTLYHPAVTGATVKAMLEAPRILNQSRTFYVGVWTDKSGNQHLDYAYHVDKYNEAMSIAKYRKQLAFWDIGMGREVVVNQ